MLNLDAKLPGGPIEEAWTNHKDQLRLVGPNNRPKYKVLVVGTGLAGASAAASMAAMGYQVESFCFQDTKWKVSAFKTRRDALTASRLKVALTLRKTIATMAIRLGVCSPTRKRAVTSALARPMFTAWPN